jgi:hypothetical protein
VGSEDVGVPSRGHTGGVLFARTVGLGEALILAAIITVVVVASLIAFRHRTNEDA